MKSVLVVEDQKEIRAGICTELEVLGEYFTMQAGDYPEAMEFFHKNNIPDVVLTDIMMPSGNHAGLDLVRKLKAHEEWRLVPIIMLSAKSSAEDIITALKLGAMDYVVKPYAPEDLLERIDRAYHFSHRYKLTRQLERRIRKEDALFSEAKSLEFYTSRQFKFRTLAHIEPICSTLVPYIEGRDRDFVFTALTEAMKNAIVHGNLDISSDIIDQEDGLDRFNELIEQRLRQAPYSHRIAEVHFHRIPQQMRIKVTDQGAGFEVNELTNPSDPDAMMRMHGRGIAMMRLGFDEVTFTRLHQGMEVELIKYLDQRMQL